MFQSSWNAKFLYQPHTKRRSYELLWNKTTWLQVAQKNNSSVKRHGMLDYLKLTPPTARFSSILLLQIEICLLNIPIIEFLCWLCASRTKTAAALIKHSLKKHVPRLVTKSLNDTFNRSRKRAKDKNEIQASDVVFVCSPPVFLFGSYLSSPKY